MHSPGPSDGLIVSTPERVSFAYQVAGIGSRFLAQLIDVLLLLAIIVAFTIIVAIMGAFSGAGTVVLLVWVIATFVIFFGYFPLSEAAWSGQTLGKRVLRLRVVGDRGEPVTRVQVAVRNLIRLIDFLPGLYGIGIVALFWHGNGKRLGDIAAGTIVVRDRDPVRLKDLVARIESPAPVLGRARVSIWAADRQPDPVLQTAPRVAPPAPQRNVYHEAARRMTPDLARFVRAYLERRNSLDWARRAQLAERVAQPLRALAPAQFAEVGAVGVLDGIAAVIYEDLYPRPSA
jgi:uncharacterized RDD family membrane protein YckC